MLSNKNKTRNCKGKCIKTKFIVSITTKYNKPFIVSTLNLYYKSTTED
jgi:hypothetical protein